jgi:transcriptional regulator with GAF, ATPase, and Fis domain
MDTCAWQTIKRQGVSRGTATPPTSPRQSTCDIAPKIATRSSAKQSSPPSSMGQVAPSDATVLIQGETGTGKELIARAIHRRSRSRERPLVKVNCATLPAGLVERELFGHEKGAFAGAVARKIGRFELADGGTLFLDEIGELLCVLREGECERVGGAHPLTVEVRVIAATNRDLTTAVPHRPPAPSHEPAGGGAGPHSAHPGAAPQYAAVPPAETRDQASATPALGPGGMGPRELVSPPTTCGGSTTYGGGCL